ncbi:cytochrome C1 heme lyase [Stachybotrys elegans]|uniref:Holocytochrome c-type synthase n=1 Tax=Stachybotrys elegans TaxID=80388 RepID=A0A8K0SGZ9_9HYPO|nr:cytochrome C1 heme lyase [Stachybotrys elegans]
MADKTSESACPVDHKARDAWMAQARAASSSQPAAPNKCPVDHTQPAAAPRTWTQTITSYLPWSSSPSPPSAAPSSPHGALDTDRVISSIPRSSSGNACPVEHGASANAEVETGTHASGNWVYPSEKMFFEAMKRKGYDARETDMKTVVPIHNAVNERAWKEIQEWEKPYLENSKCGGPKLESFANKMDRMTPTARFNTLLGYSAPFDRHDWVIDRCGVRVDYVIDFYAGKPNAKGGPSFYLDVRPKLNTWEGVKMRAMRLTHLA